MQKVDRAEVRTRVGEAIDLVRLTGLNTRRPGALSGGQQQRVALARALVNRPKVLLLDEPLGALDLKLRQTMQLELKDIQSNVGITFVYVTHDQEEALTMSDRIGVMNEGKLVQIGRSEEIYEFPTDLFVAGFVGEMSLLKGEIAEPGSVRLGGGEVVRARTNSSPGTSITLILRPEKLHLYGDVSELPPGRNALKGSVARRTFYGNSLSYDVDIGASGSFDVQVENIPSMTRWDVGDEVIVDFHPEAAAALAE
jgi:spermidine/putrescine transport system ATP-binding protein